MKLSNTQKNYLNAIALRDEVADRLTGHEDDNHPAVKAYEDALDLVELREIELFRWAKQYSSKLCSLSGITDQDVALLNDMFDRLISGNYVRFNLRQDLVKLCTKIIEL